MERSLANFFRRGNLIALREMALQRVTRAVDRTLDEYVRRKTPGSRTGACREKSGRVRERNAQARDLIARGARLAEALSAELYVLHVAARPRRGGGTQARAGKQHCSLRRIWGRRSLQLTGSRRAARHGAYIARAPHYAGHRWPVRDAGPAQLPVLLCDAEVHGGGAARGPAHRDAGEA